MPKPGNAKVWNEDLVRALKARCEHERQQGLSTYLRWSESAQAIEAIRRDIYTFSNGRIVGLPRLKITVDNEVRGIIRGEVPLYPPGYVPTNREFEHDYSNDPYLKKIKCNGGAFAILLAFHFSNSDTMTKAQICEAAQPFCDDGMEANFMAGRSYGAWKSIDTLVKHDFVHVNRTNARNEDNSWRSNGCWTWTISNNGKKFSKAMMEKFNIKEDGSGQDPHSANRMNASAGSEMSRPRFSFSPQRRRAKSATLTPGSSAKKSSRTKELHQEDKKQLLEWLQTARPPEKKRYNVGKQRRQMLHDLCDELMKKYVGLTLDHRSDGDGANRALYVTIVTKDCTISDTKMVNTKETPTSAVVSPASSTLTHFTGAGHTLGEGSPPKKLRTGDIPASVLAGNAALNRQSITGSSTKPIKQYRDIQKQQGSLGCRAKKPTLEETIALLESDSDDDDDWLLYDRKPAAIAKKKPNQEPDKKPKQESIKSKEPDIIELLEDSDEEEEGDPGSVMLDGKGSSDEPVELEDSQVDLPQPCNLNFAHLKGEESMDDDAFLPQRSTEQNSSGDARSGGAASGKKPQLTILIDNRERNKNASPRQMRMDLIRHLTSGLLKRVWPADMPEAQVLERGLVVGDFAFEIDKNALVQRRIPLAIERKRVSDLVQRSAKGDHWRQLQRMCGNCEYATFLIEGDTVTASQFACGSQQLEEWLPDYYTVGDERGVFLFAGRAILNSRKTRFIQTKDEQSSLRAVGAFGCMAALSDVAQRDMPSPLFDPKNEQTRLGDRLLAGGIPWKLVRRIKDEIGSIGALDRLYESACESSRHLLLCPIIQNSFPDFANSVTNVAGWSQAICSAWLSRLPDPQVARSAFDKHKLIVPDQGKLLVALHSGKSVEAAIDVALSEGEAESQSLPARKVQVELPSQLEHCFPAANTEEESFYTLKKTSTRNPLNLSVPTLAMKTVAGHLVSSRLFVHVIEGAVVVEAVEEAISKKPTDFVGAARDAASLLHKQCYSSRMKIDEDQRILLVRGLNPARERAAKKPGYRQELLVVIDMAMAELNLRHGMVVLQAIRKKVEDLELIVQQLALACFHFQLLTKEIQYKDV